MQKIYTAKYNDIKTVLVSDYHSARKSSKWQNTFFYDHITYPMPSSLTLLILNRMKNVSKKRTFLKKCFELFIRLVQSYPF